MTTDSDFNYETDYVDHDLYKYEDGRLIKRPVYTHEEAKKKFCRHIRRIVIYSFDKNVVDIKNPVAKGIIVLPPHNIVEEGTNVTMVTCMADRCMSWQAVNKEKGYCLADK